MAVYQHFGLQFDPFVYLDSTKDAHLESYLVIPRTVEIAWSDSPVAILSQPGAGKSALRRYTESVYGGTRGLNLAIPYVPETFSTAPDFHLFALKRSLARAVLNYLVSYPDLFLTFSDQHQSAVGELLRSLPFDLEFFIDVARGADLVTDLENWLLMRPISKITHIGLAHNRLFDILQKLHQAGQDDDEILDLLIRAKSVLSIKAIHLLVDGLDGFIETSDKNALLDWIAPLISVSKQWAEHDLYFKFFLPLHLSDFPGQFSRAGIQTAALSWDDGLLAEVIRRRLYVASGGAFDSLDALSTPDLRNVELRLARQIPPQEKTPRRIIRQTAELLQKVQATADGYIHAEDLVMEERAYVR